MSRPSRVLYITHTSPVPAKIGPSRRHYHILGQLSRFYEVHLLSLGTQTQAEMFDAGLKNRVAGYDYALSQYSGTGKFVRKARRTLTGRCDFLPVLEPSLRSLCRQITCEDSFDAIVLSIVLLRGLPLPKRIPIVGDTHNVESDVLARTATIAESFPRRQYARWQAFSTFREECRCGRQVDLLLANSERDREMFEGKFGVEEVEVIPNGVDIGEFSPSRTMGEPGTILFTGLMSYYPNQQAMRWFLDKVFPLILETIPSAKLIVAGARPPDWLMTRSNVPLEVTGPVPDMRPYFERARVVIAPLMIGGGTRVKILEAQAMARPVVSTSLGAEGLDVRDGQSILLADDAASFAAQVVRVLRDDEIALKLGAAGRADVVSTYDWNRIGERLEEVLRRRLGLVSREVAECGVERGLLDYELCHSALQNSTIGEAP
jgi:polysaccharide biosynthesis protein PslH